MGLLLFRRMTRIFLGTGTRLALGTSASVNMGPSTLASSKLNSVHEVGDRPIIRYPNPNPIALGSQAFNVVINTILKPACAVHNVVNPPVLAPVAVVVRLQNLSATVQISVL